MSQSTMPVLIEHGTYTRDDELVRLAGAFVANYGSEATRRAYADDLRLYFRWCRASGVDPIIGIRRTHLEVYARDMENRGLAPATRARRIGTVRGWYEWLIDEELFDEQNPVRKVKSPTATVVRDRPVLTKREMHILNKASKDHSPQMWAVVALGYFNGLRIGEILGANVTDIGHVGYHTTLKIRGKGAKYDEVPLPPPALEAVTAAVNGRDVGPLIEGLPGGARATRRQVARALDRICKQHGLTRITPHSLRRTAITIALQERTPIREVQLLARHASSKTTERYDQRTRSMDEHLGSVLIRAIA